MNFGLISKERFCICSGNDVPTWYILSTKNKLKRLWNNAPHRTTLRRQATRSVDESVGCFVACAPSLTSFVLFLMAQDRKISLSRCIGWAEGVFERSGDEAIEVSSLYPLVFSSLILLWFARLLGFRDGWPIDHAENLSLRPPWFISKHHRRRTMWLGLCAWPQLLLRSYLVSVRILSPRSRWPKRPFSALDSTWSFAPPRTYMQYFKADNNL